MNGNRQSCNKSKYTISSIQTAVGARDTKIINCRRDIVPVVVVAAVILSPWTGMDNDPLRLLRPSPWHRPLIYWEIILALMIRHLSLPPPMGLEICWELWSRQQIPIRHIQGRLRHNKPRIHTINKHQGCSHIQGGMGLLPLHSSIHPT